MTEATFSLADLPTLPATWQWARLDDLQPEFQNGESSRGDAVGDPVPVLRLADVKSGLISLDALRYVRLPERSRTKYALAPDDVLVIRVNGSRDLVGSFVPAVGGDLIYCDHFIRMRVSTQHILPEFLTLLGRWHFIRRQIESSAVSTAGQLTINQGQIRSLVLPVPPLPEQHRIVAAIEEQFPRLDAGVVALERAQHDLKRMRAAELQQLVGYQRDSQLPDGWQWVTIADVAGDAKSPVLTGPFGTSLSRSDFVPEGVPVLTIGCLTESGISVNDAPRVPAAKAEQLNRYSLQTGDLLFSRMATVGRAAVVDESAAGCLINYHLMRLRLDKSVILPHYLALLCRGSGAIQTYLVESNHGVTRPGINTTQLLGLPVALPRLDQQEEIIETIARSDDLARSLAAQIEVAKRRADALRSSILAAAFSGKLVPQDPSDEPASAVLERIAAERAAASNGHKRTGTPRQGRLPL